MSSEAPTAGQEDTCWSCGATWDYRRATRNPLRVIRDRAGERSESGHQLRTATLR